MDIECVQELEPQQKAEWDNFLASSPFQHPRQDHRFAAVERKEGADVLFVMGRVAGVLVGVGLLSRTRHPFVASCYSDAIFLSGPVCDNSETMIDFLNTIFSHSDFARIGRVRITPYWLEDNARTLHSLLQNSNFKLSTDGVYRNTGLVDISSDPDVVVSRFSKSARREVRRAERAGVSIVPIQTREGASEFLDSLNRLREGRGLNALSEGSFLQGFNDIYKEGDKGILLGAFSDSALVGGLLLYRSANTAHGRHFTTEPQLLHALKNLRISPVLWLAGMNWARSKGCLQLDVEGYVETSDKLDKKFHIYKYKSEFAPMPIIRIGERYRVSNRFLHLTGNGKELLKDTARRWYRALKN